MNPDFFTVAKTEPGDCGNDPKVIPEWVDETKVRQGQKYYRKYFMSVYISCLSSLCVGFCIPSLLTTLTFTKESETTTKMFHRYLRTIQYMDKWYRGDIWNQEGEVFHSLQRVRKIHRNVAKQQMISDAAPTDGSVAISQYDMVLTQFGFFGLLIVYPLKFGVWHSEKEVEGLIHFWRCIGYLLGIDEKYNLCAGTYKETLVKCQQLVDCVTKTNLLNPPPDFEHTARSLLIALRPIIPGLDYDSFGPFTFSILGVPFKRSSTSGLVKKKNRFMSWVLRLCCNWLLFIPPFRMFFNWRFYKSIQRAEAYAEFLLIA